MSFLSRGRAIATALLLGALVVCLLSAWWTRDRLAIPEPQPAAGAPSSPVDLRAWQTAQTLAGLPMTTEEWVFSQEAERLADHAVDQAFASALRQASLRHPKLTGEALRLSQKVAELAQLVKDDQARVAALTKPDQTDDLDIAKAQLGLETDELTEAQQDLARAGGDEPGRIQQALAAHEAAMAKYDSQAGKSVSPPAATAPDRYGNVAAQLKAWTEQHTRAAMVRNAQADARREVDVLMTRHNATEKQAGAASAQGASTRTTDKAAMMAGLKNRTALTQLMGIYDDRMETEKQLAVVYGKWSAQLADQQRMVLHALLQSIATIAFILICVIALDALVLHYVNRPALDSRRMETLRTIFQLSVQVVGVLLTLLVVFGVPRQLPTILGLTTAGLTVVLQDFIIAFFGWFVLMGKNGIRIGDWVEINGVGGEVTEIGIFRTGLLETGKDRGYATGRRVTFINSFAIRGQYFNFSTTGQWMWDEIRVSVPQGDDTYDIIENIHQAVLKETEEDTRVAEEEWQRVTNHRSVSPFIAGPAVDLRPGASGIDIVIRFATRAAGRLETRNRIYQRVLELLHKPALNPQQ